MLKLNYTEVGLYMEQSMTVPEMLIAHRVVLTMRLGQSLHVEPGRASFLLPADIPELEQLKILLRKECNPTVTIIPVDDISVDVGLRGSWIAEDRDAHEGTFLAVMSDRTELCIYTLWQMSEARISSLA